MWFLNLFDSLKLRRSSASIQQARRAPPRRQRCRLALEALEDRCVPASFSVGDATIVEGNAGIQYAAVVVSLDAPRKSTVTVNYSTANGTATAGSDYQAVSGQLTFAKGETSNTILVPIHGDRAAEPAEYFYVKLSNPTKGAKIADGTGVVTIMEDEPRISISHVAPMEGNSGTTLFTFTVSLSNAYDQDVTLHYSTGDGTAIAGEDYLATSGMLTFAPGETTKTITVEILGDTTPEPAEAFFVDLGGASVNAFIAVRQGVGSILDDDGYYDGSGGDDYPGSGGYPDYGYGESYGGGW